MLKEKSKKDKAVYMIKSVIRALSILEEFLKGEEEIGVSEIARRVGLHKNNVFRVLATLETFGYVEQNRYSESYRLGIKSFLLGEMYKRNTDLILRSKEIIKKLADRLQETVVLSVIRQDRVFNIDCALPESL